VRRTRSRLLVVLLGALGLFAAVSVLGGDGSGGDAGASDTASRAERSAGASRSAGDEPGRRLAVPGDARTDGPLPLEPAERSGDGRERVARRLRGRLAAAGGGSVAGSVVSWTPREALAAARDAEGSAGALAAVLLERTAFARVAAGGRYELGLPEASEGGGLLAVSHPEHRARVAWVGVGAGPWAAEHAFELEPHPPSTVLVSDGSGSAVAGARVVQLARGDAVGAEPARGERPWVVRTATTDERGAAALHPFDGELTVWAELGERRSAPWRGPARDGLRLVLTGELGVGGRVALGAGLEQGTALRIECFALVGNDRRSLEVLDVAAGAEWGPVRLPLLPDAAYLFRLDGGDCIPQEVRLDAPRTGSVHAVDFVADAGEDVWLVVVDADEQPLRGAEAEVSWYADGRRVSARATVERDDGFVRVRGCRPGPIELRARCEGHAPGWADPTVIPEPEPVGYWIRLPAAGVLRGRCLHAGRPVEDFQVVAWQRARPDRRIEHFVRGSRDGTFELATAPLGEVQVLALSPRHPRSAVATAAVARGRPGEVVLELPAAVRGRGRVVDARTREPLASAEVRVLANARARPIVPDGPPRRVRSDGTFELDRLAPGTSLVHASAPGSAPLRVDRVATEGEELDLGLIPLIPARTLTVRLESRAAFDPTQYFLRVEDQPELPVARFDADGIARLDGLSHGFAALRVHDRADERVLVLSVRLEAEREWDFTLRLDGGPEVLAEVVPGEGREVGPDWTLLATCSDPAGHYATSGWAVPADGALVIGGLSGREAVLRLVDGTGRDLGATRVDLEAAPPRVARIELGRAPYRFAVVDREGRAADAVDVSVFAAGTPAPLYTGTTDLAGRFEAFCPPGTEVLLDLGHPELAQRSFVTRVLPASTGEVVRIVLDAGARVEVVVLDGDVPVPNVRATLGDPRDRVALRPRYADASGRLGWKNLSEGSYSVVVDDPDYWPTETVVEASADGAPSPVRTRRRGDLELCVRDADGAVAAGATVELTAPELGASVASWLDRGLVRCRQPGLVTDAAGSLVLEGLPHGTYRWSASAGAASGAGELTVRAAQRARVTVVLLEADAPPR